MLIAVFFVLVLITAVVLQRCCQPKSQTPLGEIAPTYWSQTLKNDLNQMKQILKRNHPAPTSKGDDGAYFRFWLNNGYKKGIELADNVDSYNGYKAVCEWFINRFHDSQLQLYFSLSRNPKIEWPGFMLKYQEGKFIVSHVDANLKFEGLPPEGSELISCNGVDVKILMKQSIFLYLADPLFEKSWILYGAHLLKYEEGNPWSKRFEVAEFKVNGKVKEFSLRYQSLSLLEWERVHFSSLENWFLEDPSWTVREFAKDQYWVSLPSFEPTGHYSKKTVSSFITELEKMSKPRLIVLDLRNNMGGDEEWSDRILESIFGKDFVDFSLYQYRKQAFDVWRVSEDNLKMLDEKDNPRLYASLSQAIKEGKNRWKQYYDSIESPQKSSSKLPKGVRVYVVTDPWVDAEALVFLDKLFLLGDIIQVGCSTMGNPAYTGVVQKLLSSKEVTFGYPMKATGNPLRQANEVYEPTFRFHDAINNTEALEKWIIEIDREITLGGFQN